MKINFETKFSLGDRVWIINSNFNNENQKFFYTVREKPSYISAIFYRCTVDGAIYFRYELDSKIDHNYDEIELSAGTREKVLKEVEKFNEEALKDDEDEEEWEGFKYT